MKRHGVDGLQWRSEAIPLPQVTVVACMWITTIWRSAQRVTSILLIPVLTLHHQWGLRFPNDYLSIMGSLAERCPCTDGCSASLPGAASHYTSPHPRRNKDDKVCLPIYRSRLQISLRHYDLCFHEEACGLLVGVTDWHCSL